MPDRHRTISDIVHDPVRLEALALTGKPARPPELPYAPARVGDWMQTYTGLAFWPLDPRPEEINIDDISHALSMQCRYAGHCRTFYSVAEHSVWCALMALMPTTDFVFCKNISAAIHHAKWMLCGATRHIRPEVANLAFHALMHDAAETYLVDLPRPIKRSMPEYRRAEHLVEQAIAERFRLSFPMPDEVKRIDESMLATEARALMAQPPYDWSLEAEPFHLRDELLGNDHRTACGAFREMFALLNQNWLSPGQSAAPEPMP